MLAIDYGTTFTGTYVSCLCLLAIIIELFTHIRSLRVSLDADRWGESTTIF